MKLINRVGGAFLLAILAIATISGFQSTTGRPIWDNLWNATATVLGYARTQVARLNGSPIDGHPFSAIGLAALLVLVVIALVLAGAKKSISFQGFTLILLGGAVVAFILWDPTVLR
ncbi:MAG TPA: hypothetical protein VI357_11130 [Mycobacteriales bacterium]